MNGYKVDSVVCDYGIFEDEKLVLICNSLQNAKLIKAILEKDSLCNKSDYVFKKKDYNNFILDELSNNNIHESEDK